MAGAKIGDTVRVHYTGRLEDGTVFDSSLGSEPLQFTIGDGRLIEGFEESVIGMNVGESKTVNIPPEKAYGPYHDELVAIIGRDRFPEDLDLEVGQQLQLRQEDGHVILVTVVDITEQNVTLDANHPLAGRNLIFDIQLVDIL